MATVFDSLRFSLPVKDAEEGAQKVLFSVVPDAEKLYCIVASYEEIDKPSSSIYSYHSWTILKCRRLIFSFPELIATPDLGGLCQIYIIISKYHYDLNKLQPFLKELGLSFQRPTFVVNTTYEACLRYTITARLAPSWNLVGNHYIQGRDFVTVNKPMNSVRIEVTIIGDQLQLLVWPSRVVMSPVVLNNFHLSETADDSKNQVLDIEDYNIQVYVLPSMKPAKATFLQTKLPKSSPFKSFKEIRRYWKNIYGLRLLENVNLDPTFLYVTVKFNKQHPGLTYPVICLKSNPLITLRPRNESEILKDFLTDLIQRIPNLCGYPFAAEAYLGVAMHKLVHPTLFSENPNLTSTIPLGELLTPLHPIFLSDNNNKSNNVVPTKCTDKPRSVTEEELKKDRNTMLWPTTSVNSTNSSVTTITLTTTAASTATSRSIHCTNSSASSIAQTVSGAVSEPFSSSLVVQKHSSRLPDQLNGFFNNIDCKQKIDEQFGKPVPIFRPFNSEINSTDSLSYPKYAPVFYPRHRTGVKPVSATLTSSYFNSREASVGHNSITVSQYSHQSPKTTLYVHSNSCHRSSSMKETSITMSSLLKRDSCSLKTNESGVKKRSRPQVQADVDVSAMARSSEGLTRVNTTTLIAYLRAKGIPCKVKDKKGDLVAKVMAHLKTTSTC